MIGQTDFSRSDVQGIIEQMGREYKGMQYHLLKKNCNHFTTAMTTVSKTYYVRQNS